MRTGRAFFQSRRWSGLLLFAAGIAPFVALCPMVGNDFVDWDDRPLLIDQDAYRGLTPSHFRWMWTTTLGGHYQPVTWLSFALEHRLCGLTTFSAHLINLLLHAASCMLLYLLARRLIRAVGGLPEWTVSAGAMTAVLWFGLHPLRVESVAWATARRDVLAAFWLLLATLFYLRTVPSRTACDESPSPPERSAIGLGAAAFFFVLSLLSKAAGMTWPAVLLLLDRYPLRRIRASSRANRRIEWRACLREKMVFIIAALGSACAALMAQRRAGALWSLEEHSIGLRIGQAMYGMLFYLGKMIWPVPLLPLYEQPTAAADLTVQYILAGAGVIVMAVTLVAFGNRWIGLATAWWAYGIFLLPALGGAQSGPQLVADRYSLLPSLPWCLFLGGLMARVLSTGSNSRDRAGLKAAPRSGHAPSRRWFFVKPVAAIATVGCVLVSYVRLTRAQVTVWKDTRSLWSHVLIHAPETGLAHANLAVYYLEIADYPSARRHALEAVRILPGNQSAYRVAASASLALGEVTAAEQHLRAALKQAFAGAETWAGLADVLIRQGRLNEAEACLHQALEIEPAKALWHFAYGAFLAAGDRREEAALAFQEAIRLEADFADAYLELGKLYARRSEWNSALDTWALGLRERPGHVGIALQLSWALSTCPDESYRDGPRSLALARQCVPDDGAGDPRIFETLAAALARTGEFDAALACLALIQERWGDDLSPTMLRRMDKAIRDYQIRSAFEDSPQP